MRFKLIVIIAVVAAAILLIPPTMAWYDIELGEDVVIDIHATAYCEGASMAGVFTQEFDIDRVDKRPSYWTYIGDYWSGSASTGASVPPTGFPFVAILVQVRFDESTRVTEYFPYVYGETFAWNGEFTAVEGDILVWQMQIYWRTGASTYVHEYVEVVV